MRSAVPGVLVPLAAVATALAAPRPAAAGPQLACQQAEAGSVELDGMLDDWKGVAKVRGGGTAADASFDLYCLYDGDKVYLAVDVRDEHVQRQAKFDAGKPAGDDRVTVSLGAAGNPRLTLALFPGVDKQVPRRMIGKKPIDKGIGVEDTLEPKGFSIEVAVPGKRLAGWSASTPSLDLDVTFEDADVPKLAATENTVTWSGALLLGGATDLLGSFLVDARLTKNQLTLDAQADVDKGKPGAERVVAGGDVLGLLTDKYTFAKLPVQKPADVVKVELVDLRGDGSKLVAVTLRQRGGGGSRELLTLWAAYQGQFEQLGAVEIGKEQGGNKLRSTWKIEAAKGWKQAPKTARKVLVVRAQPAVGWDEDSYGEEPAGDAEPIHVPWDDDRTGGVFWIDAAGQLATAPIKR